MFLYWKSFKSSGSLPEDGSGKLQNFTSRITWEFMELWAILQVDLLDNLQTNPYQTPCFAQNVVVYINFPCAKNLRKVNQWVHVWILLVAKPQVTTCFLWDFLGKWKNHVTIPEVSGSQLYCKLVFRNLFERHWNLTWKLVETWVPFSWKTKDLSKQCLVAKHIYCDFRWCFGVATWPKMEDWRSRKHAWCRNVASLQSGPFYCLKIPVKTWPQPNQQNRFLKARSRKMQQT